RKYFCHPTTNEKVTVFLDPCHSLKLLRNYLGEHKSIIDDNNDIIQWEYFSQLHDIQVKEGLHLDPTMNTGLRVQHIQYNKQKMKVKLAVQVFSASVGDALDICKSDLQFPACAESAATIRFIRINDLFDTLNSMSMKQMGFKKPLHKHALREGYTYLSQLRNTKDNQLLMYSKSKAVLGFMICIKSLTILYDDI
ncbi:THAP domain-containing protein, partial [Ooceraea biroi]